MSVSESMNSVLWYITLKHRGANGWGQQARAHNAGAHPGVCRSETEANTSAEKLFWADA